MNLCRYVMVANAHNDPGEDGMKLFNIGYLAGISGILLAWNAAVLIKVLMSSDYLPFTILCFKKPLVESIDPLTTRMRSVVFHPITIRIAVVILCLVFSVIITIRTKSYLTKLQDRHLRNLPSKNALTFLDTQILFWILSASSLLKSIVIMFQQSGFLSFDNLLIVNNIISLVWDNFGACFIFPIYIILKTKRYLPKMWDSSRQIVAENNDFYCINPATVGIIQPLPQPNHEMLESRL